MAKTIHRLAAPADNHVIHGWEVSSAAARLALTPTASDLGRVARQSDDGSLWACVGAGPASWKRVDFDHSTSFAATGATTARSVSDRASDVVNVKDFGAVGDGTADDTAAIKSAIAFANGLGTDGAALDTGGDAYSDVYSSTRRKKVVFLPPGTYKTTSTIRIARADVALAGTPSSWPGGSPFNDLGTTIIAEHAGNLFQLDANFNPYNFSVSNILLAKRYGGPHQGTGAAISVPAGSNWLSGLGLHRVRIRFFYDAVNLVGALAGYADVKIENCIINNNAGRAIWTNTAQHMSVSFIQRNVISQNTVGGIWVGAKGVGILDNDLEGQPDPLKLHGTANTDCRIEGNYFEGNTGSASIQLQTSNGITVERNIWSSSTVPKVLATSSSNIRSDVPVVPIGCHNVQAPAYEYGGPSGYISESWNVNSAPGVLGLQKTSGIPSLTLMAAAGTLDGAVFAGNMHTRVTSLSALASATATSGTFNIAPNAIVGISVVAKYDTTLPASQMSMVIRGWNGSSYDTIASVGFASRDVLVGDSVRYFAAAKNLTATAYTKVQVQFYPFGSDGSFTGTGVISLVAAWLLPATIARPVDVLQAEGSTVRRIFGFAVPTTGTWGQGDTIQHVFPTAGGPTGWVCVTAGTPGTWAELGRSLGRVQVTAGNGATVTPDAAASSVFEYIGANTAGATMTIAAPTNPTAGQIITIQILSNAAGAVTVTWNAVFHFAAATKTPDPAASQCRATQFLYEFGVWREIARTSGDVA